MSDYRIAWAFLSDLPAHKSTGWTTVPKSVVKAGCEQAFRELESFCGVRFGDSGKKLTIIVRERKGWDYRAWHSSSRHEIGFNALIGSKTPANRWTGQKQIYALCRHELGHELGLNHVNTRGNVMHLDAPSNGTWTPSQIEYLVRKHGPVRNTQPTPEVDIEEAVKRIEKAMRANKTARLQMERALAALK